MTHRFVPTVGRLMIWAMIWAVAADASGGQGQESSSGPTSPPRTVLNRYCTTCHNERLKTANLLLDKAAVEDPGREGELWENVIRKLRTGAMPPAGAPRPDKATAASLAQYLEDRLDQHSIEQPNPGRTVPHRLNRAEYVNAVRDFLAIDSSALEIESLFPPDDSGYGFDNIGDVLSLSPLLLERYLAVARKVSRLAIGDPAMRPDSQTYEVSRFLNQADRGSEELPFGSRGGVAQRHFFPLDAEYVLKINLKRDWTNALNPIIGLDQLHEIDLRLDGKRIKLFTFGGEKDKAQGTRSGPNRQERVFDNSLSEAAADSGLEFRVPVTAGEHLVGVSFLVGLRNLALEEVLRPAVATQEANDEAAVASVVVAGPYLPKGPGETPSRKKIFSCYPTAAGSNPAAERECARKILFALARQAQRGLVSDAHLKTFLEFYDLGRNQGGFEKGIELAIQRLLISPEFLFRIERDPPELPPDSPYRISDRELVSRLSFFLWSSIPDDQLLDLAQQGKLREPEVLEAQVRRMLIDPRAKALIRNFAGQWLFLRNVQTAAPDLKEYPHFDDSLREAFQRESELFVEMMLKEDRKVTDLLNADFTFLNERLARHYGVSGIYGSHFRRVVLSEENRRGLIGQGSILMVTSYPNRTSPTLRGKWILENILGSPPPPPPPDVPSLSDRGADGKILSMRQQLDLHRTNPVCSSCHSRMDPIGFALENFDAIGGWRTTSGSDNTPIDSSGVLPDGSKFDGPSELRKLLNSRSEQFVAVVIEKLLTYAMGRGLEYYDAPGVRKIMRNAAPSDYRWSSMVVGIVKSEQFQMRRSAAK